MIMRLKGLILIISLTIVFIFFSISIGPTKILSFKEIILIFNQNTLNDNNLELIRSIVLEVRVPRVLLSFLVGSALSISGAVLQSLFRNPLISPDVIGLTSGSAFGAALAVAFPFLNVQLSSFCFGILATTLTFLVARLGGRGSITEFILSGVIVSGFFTSLLTILQFIVDPFKLQTIIHWLMGNLHTANFEKVKMVYIQILIGSIWLLLFSFRLNVLSFGEAESKAVGLNPNLEKIFVLFPTALIATSAISVSGIIGMIGLIIPHLVRMFVGPDNRKVIPFSFLIGGNFLVIVDTFSRSLFEYELPVGVFTTLIGTPFFVYVLKTRIDNVLRD
ncbi:MAG: iron ABC transporter permease [Proteobacteria bacterium]|nr:iron ABC transporter permease [Pseudomonadota bacterium]